MSFCFEVLKSTKISSYEPVEVKSTKMGTGRKFVTLQYLFLSLSLSLSLSLKKFY